MILCSCLISQEMVGGGERESEKGDKVRVIKGDFAGIARVN